MSFFDFNTKKQSTFIIYTMDALSNSTNTNTDNVALEFTSLKNIEYNCDVRIPYEPIEQGGYTSDSQIEQPFTLKLQVVYSPVATSSKDTINILRQKITDVELSLNTYQKNSTLLVLFNTYPITTVYENIKLLSVNHRKNSDMNMLIADLTFQEVRITGVDYESFTDATLLEPENADTLDSGVVSPVDTDEVLEIA